MAEQQDLKGGTPKHCPSHTLTSSDIQSSKISIINSQTKSGVYMKQRWPRKMKNEKHYQKHLRFSSKRASICYLQKLTYNLATETKETLSVELWRHSAILLDGNGVNMVNPSSSFKGRTGMQQMTSRHSSEFSWSEHEDTMGDNSVSVGPNSKFFFDTSWL